MNLDIGDMPIDIFCDYISDILEEYWSWEYLLVNTYSFHSQFTENNGDGDQNMNGEYNDDTGNGGGIGIMNFGSGHGFGYEYNQGHGNNRDRGHGSLNYYGY